MRKITSILFLTVIVLQLFVMEIHRISYKQYLTEESSENNRVPKEVCDESCIKFLQPVGNFIFSGDIFYLLSKEKFAHLRQHPVTIDWLDTFSPPPEIS